MPLVFAVGCGSVAFWVVTTLLFAAGLWNTKYQIPIAPRKNRSSAAAPPKIKASFAGLRPPGLGKGGSVVAVAVAGTGGGTFAVVVVGGAIARAAPTVFGESIPSRCAT